MYPSQGGWVGYEVPESDLAILGCFEESFKNTPVKFLDIDKIGDSYLAEDALFFCQGFPGQLHVAFPYLRQYQSAILPIIGRFKKIIRNKNGDQIMYCMDYPSNVNPKGMSGSGVWNLNLHKVPGLNKWEKSQITFAGVVQKWNPREKELIITKSSVVSDFLKVGIDRFIKHFPRTDK
jgi:hypothetical protein